MPPKRGKKGKRRGGESSSEGEAENAAAAVVVASLNKSSTVDAPTAAAGGPAPTGAGKKIKNKKKGNKGRGNNNNDDSDSDDGNALDPLAHLRGPAGRRKGGALRGGGDQTDGDEDEDRPKKPLTKKEKRRLEEEQRRREKEEAAAAGGDSSEDEEGGDSGDDGAKNKPAAGVTEAGLGEGQEKNTNGSKDRKSKKGKKGDRGVGGDSDGEGNGDGDDGDNAANAPKKKPPTKKEQRRLDEQERIQRELAAEQAAAEAERGEGADSDNRGEDGGSKGDHEKKEDTPLSIADQFSKRSKKGKKKGKGKGRTDDDDDDTNNASDKEKETLLSRGMESLRVADDGSVSPPLEAPPGRGSGKMSKKQRRKAESLAAAAAEAEMEVEGAEEEEDDSAKLAEADAAELARKEAEESAAATASSAASATKSKSGGDGGDSEDEDDGQKRRMSKKERKKAKQQGGKKKSPSPPVVEEAPEPSLPTPQPIRKPTAAAATAAAGDPTPPPATVATAAAQQQSSDMDVVGLDGDKDGSVVATAAAATSMERELPNDDSSGGVAGSAVVAGAVEPAAEPKAKLEEVAVPTKKPKKEKKSKLIRKLENAARLKAEAEAAAGVGGGGAEQNARLAKEVKDKEEEEKRKEGKKARKAKKEAAKDKDSKVKSILEDLDDVEYYGSDHEEAGKQRKEGTGAKETVEEELARLVAAAEAGGKTATARQRKKILQEIESRRRAAAEEVREELAHREGAQFGCSQTAVSASDQQWNNSLDITIESFSISAHDKTLFKDSPLQVVHGRKYGLVGPNGAGKSTLLKMIASGDLKIPPRIDCLYVEQEVVADDTPAVIAVMKADKARWTLMEEERKLNRLLRKDPENEKLNDRLQQVHEELHTSGGDGAEAHARRILFGLGFDDIMQVKATKHFSGGWRMRISLARALFMEPTLLCLDEPTNHLDLNAVIWLDDYLQKWKKTLLVVSHDQDFLNSVCEEILHLDSQRVNQYKGNYDQFKEMEAQKRKQQAKEWEKQQRRLAALKKGGQSKGKAEETVKKSKFREPGGSKKKKNDAVAAGTGEVEKAQLVERPRDYVVTLNFPEVSKLSPPVLEVMDVDFKYATGPTILKDVNFGLDQTSRVCIVGPNGAGKTTLLKLMTGDLEPTEGFIRRNPRMRAGIYNQHFVDRLPMDIDPTSYLRSKFSDQCDYQTARNLLGKFGLEGHAHTIKMRDLSGGQKARVVFCELSLQAPHVLFLDEPTNNLDIESIDALCTAVTQFNGGVVVVTHDARLIEATECRLWIVDEQEVTPWQGEFDEYRADLLQKLEDKLAAQEQARADKLSSA